MEHPATFTKKQIDFFNHLTDDFNNYFKAEVEEDLHPIRLTEKQVGFIRHLLNEKALEYYEEESIDLLSTIESAEKGREAKHV